MNQIKGYGKKIGFDIRHVRETDKSVEFVHNKKTFAIKKAKPSSVKEEFIRHVAHSLLNKNWNKTLGFVRQEILEKLSSYCRCLLYLCTRGLNSAQIKLLKEKMSDWDGFEVEGDFKTTEVLEHYLDSSFTLNHCISLIQSTSTFLDFLDGLHTEVMGVEINVVYDTEEKSEINDGDDDGGDDGDDPAALRDPLKLWVTEKYLYGTAQKPNEDVQKVIDILGSSEDLPSGVEMLQTPVEVFDSNGKKQGQVSVERAASHTRLYKKYKDIENVYI